MRALRIRALTDRYPRPDEANYQCGPQLPAVFEGFLKLNRKTCSTCSAITVATENVTPPNVPNEEFFTEVGGSGNNTCIHGNTYWGHFYVEILYNSTYAVIDRNSVNKVLC
jgi:hypothetical protein